MRNRLVKLFALLVVLGLALALSPVLLAQTALTPKPTAQMHDVAGVWNAAPPAQRQRGLRRRRPRLRASKAHWSLPT
jgi:hypothetical protein